MCENTFICVCDSQSCFPVAVTEHGRRIGDGDVQIVIMNEVLTDAEELLFEEKYFVGGPDKTCATNEKDWVARRTVGQEDLMALAHATKIVSDDDALMLFKKALPGASSLMQLTGPGRNLKTQALELLGDIQSNNRIDNI